MTMKSLTERLRDVLPSVEWPTLGREAQIPVYLVHNSNDAEDYFFLFDFEQFVARSKGGIFVRPVIQIFAGRNDFSRIAFARKFREVFAQEFDRMRAELIETGAPHGWIGFGLGTMATAGLLVGGVLAEVLLTIALSTDRRAVDRLWNRPSRKQQRRVSKLDGEIEQTKSQVETALQTIKVQIHPELYAHAYRDGVLGKISEMDRDAWPLPAFVREHLEHNESGSWW